MAVVILAIIVLTPSIAGVVGIYQEGTYARNYAFSVAAYLVLLFSFPCFIGTVITTMFNLYIPRKYRLAIASVAYGAMCCLGWLALFTCLVPANSFNSARMLSLMFFVADYGWWIVVALGCGMGLSLPVTARAHRHVRTYSYPLQHRMHVLLVLAMCFFGTGAIEAIVLSFTYFQVLQQTFILYLAWTFALPLACFFAIAAVFAAWSRKNGKESSNKFARFDAGIAYAILAIITIFVPSLLPVTWIGVGVLGAAFGYALAKMQK